MDRLRVFYRLRAAAVAVGRARAGFPAIVAAALAIAVAAGPAAARTYRHDGAVALPVDPGMRVVLVHAAGNCGSNCPEWISAEGEITAQTPEAFRKVLQSIGRRRPPVFIQSPGGTVVAALEVGRMLRARHMTISVTHTHFQPCQTGAMECDTRGGVKQYIGEATSNGAICASACAYLFAGGVRRLVSPASIIGIHDVSMELLLTFRLTRTDATGKKVDAGQKVAVIKVTDRSKLPENVRAKLDADKETGRSKITRYLRAMGIADEAAATAFATKPADLHIMTRSELAETGLMTDTSAGETLLGLQRGGRQ